MAAMVHIVEQLLNIKYYQPDKYRRVCARLKELGTHAPPTTRALSVLDVGSYRKVDLPDAEEYDILEKLVLLDEHNRHYWSEIITARERPHSENNYMDNELPAISKKKQKALDFSLMKMLLTSEDPLETFTKMCTFNEPDKVLRNLTRHQDPKEFLYSIRSKYRLPFPEFLRLKAAQRLENLKTYIRNKEAITALTKELAPASETSDISVLHRSLELVSDTEDAVLSVPQWETDPTEQSLTPVAAASDDGVDDKDDEPVAKRKSIVEYLISKEDDVFVSQRPPQEVEPVDSGDIAVAAAKDLLERLRVIFEESDMDDEPGLDIGEFSLAMRRISGDGMTDREIELIFMKVDANCDGNVDWDEFLEYTLREFQERDAMQYLNRDQYCDSGPKVERREAHQIQAMVWGPQVAAYSAQKVDWTNGRYYSVTPEGVLRCWTLGFERSGSDHLLVPNHKSVTCYERINAMITIPEVRILAVAFSTGIIKFFTYDDSKVDLICTIYGLPSAAACMDYVFREENSILVMADQKGHILALRWKNIFYDGFWTGLGVSQPANNQIAWALLKTLDKCLEVEGIKHVDIINQIRFIPEINTILMCSGDPVYSLIFVPIQDDRQPLHMSCSAGGFDCFDYHTEMHLIATGGKDHTLRIWQPDRLDSPVMRFWNHTGSVDKVLLTQDPKFMAAITIDSFRTIRIFDIKEQMLHQEFECPIFGLERGRVGFILFNQASDQIIYGAQEIVSIHRRPIVHSASQLTHVRSHRRPVVAALYNDLFDCIVSGCQDSSIIVWNFLTGEKILQFSNAHTRLFLGGSEVVPIRSMAFDAQKRRVMSVGEDSVIKLWNFNNGACLSRFDNLKHTEVNVVRYQKNRDLVIAGGFNQRVFMIRDTRGEDDVPETQYLWKHIHRSDIVAMEICYAQVPKTEANQRPSDTTVSALGSTTGSESQEKATVESRSDVGEVGGTSSETRTSSIEASEESIDVEADDGSQLVTASFDGEIIVWDVFSGGALACLNTDGGVRALSLPDRIKTASTYTSDLVHLSPKDSGSLMTFFGHQQRKRRRADRVLTPAERFADTLKRQSVQQKGITIPPLAPPGTDSVTCLVLLEQRNRSNPLVATILSASTDGFIRAWSPCTDGGGLKAVFYAGHTLGAYILSATTDATNELLFTADNTGYVKVWFLCDWANEKQPSDHQHGLNPRTFPVLRRYKMFAPVQAHRANYLMNLSLARLDTRHHSFYNAPLVLNSFRAHLQAINHISIVEQRQIILSASRDCSIRLWTFSGLYVGSLGQTEPLHIHIETHHRGAEVHRKTAVETDGTLDEKMDILLEEADSDDETLLKPRITIPEDLRAKGSVVTLEIIKNQKHTKWPSKGKMEAPIKLPPPTQPTPQDLTASHELDIRPNARYNQFVFHGFKSPIDYSYGEAAVYRNMSEKKFKHYESLDQVVPDCVLDYNIESIQSDWINRLPRWQRQEYLKLQRQALLYGEPLRQLVGMVRSEQRKHGTTGHRKSEKEQTAALKSQIVEERVVRTLERLGTSVRPTIVDFLLQPEQQPFVKNLLLNEKPECLDETDTVQSTKAHVAVVARNMELVTELDLLERKAIDSKYPPKPPQALLRYPSCLFDKMRHVHHVGRIERKSSAYARIARVGEMVSARKLPPVPDVRENHPTHKHSPLKRTDKNLRSVDDVDEVDSDESVLDLEAHHGVSATVLPRDRKKRGHIWVEAEPRFIEPYAVTETLHLEGHYPEVDVPSVYRRPVRMGEALEMFDTGHSARLERILGENIVERVAKEDATVSSDTVDSEQRRKLKTAKIIRKLHNLTQKRRI